MHRSGKAILAAFLISCVMTLLGVRFIFAPIAESDVPTGPLLSPAIGFFIYVAISIALFDWLAQQFQNAYKAAFTIAASQFILVNLDFVFRGERGLKTALASTVLLVLTWGSVAVVYSMVAKKSESEKSR
ncbi:MAG: hypothetical protein RIA65_04290 [Woeseia sp.]